MDSESQLWLPKRPSTPQIHKLNTRIVHLATDYIRAYTHDRKILAILSEMNKWSVEIELEKHTKISKTPSRPYDSYQEENDERAHFDICLELDQQGIWQKNEAFLVRSADATIILDRRGAAEVICKLNRKYRKVASNLLLSDYADSNTWISELEDGEPEADTYDFDALMMLEQAKREIAVLQQMRREIIDGTLCSGIRSDEFYKTDLLRRKFPNELVERGLRVERKTKKQRKRK